MILPKNIKEPIKNVIYKTLPVTGIKPSLLKTSGNIYITIALKRSGQHAVINWLCYQLNSVIHLNECVFIRKGLSMMPVSLPGRFITYNDERKMDTGYTGSNNDQKLLGSFFSKLHDLQEVESYQNILYSFENVSLNYANLYKFIHKYQPKVILIIRDPYNCFASLFSHHGGKNTLQELRKNKEQLIMYLEESLGIKNYLQYPVIPIDFGKWLKSTEYRYKILQKLAINYNKEGEQALYEVPSFGGGSSFEGTQIQGKELHSKVSERWKRYAKNLEYKELLNDHYLEELTYNFFNVKKPL